MSTTIKIVGKKDPKNERYIYLNVRTTTNRKSKLRSLGVKVLKSHWDKDKQQVSPANKSYRLINEKISAALQELNDNLNSIEVLKVENTVVLEYWKRHIPTIENASTKASHITACNNLQSYLVDTNQSSLKLALLTPEIVYKYQSFLTKKGIGELSKKIYLSFLKAIVNKAIKHQIVFYRVHPFINVITKPKSRKQNKALTIKEVNQLTCVKLSSKQNYSRNMFLFQLYGGGLRVRDLLLLSWRNLTVKENGIYLNYYQKKTNKNVVSKLSYKAIKFLSIAFPLVVKDEIDMYVNSIESGTNIIGNKKISELELLQLEKDIEAKQIKLDELIGHYLYKLQSKELNTTVFNYARDIEVQPNGFISTASKNKLIGANQRINYNLQQIAKKLEIMKFTTHTARHTYSQMLVDMGANVHHLSMLLGHSSITITQNYINSLHNSKLDDYNDQLASL